MSGLWVGWIEGLSFTIFEVRIVVVRDGSVVRPRQHAIDALLQHVHEIRALRPQPLPFTIFNLPLCSCTFRYTRHQPRRTWAAPTQNQRGRGCESIRGFVPPIRPPTPQLSLRELKPRLAKDAGSRVVFLVPRPRPASPHAKAKRIIFNKKQNRKRNSYSGRAPIEEP